MAEQDIRTQIKEILFVAHNSGTHTGETKEFVDDEADQILNIKCSRGGGVCPRCGGTCSYMLFNGAVPISIDCPTCNGTGQTPIVEFTVLEAIRAAEEGKICGGEK